MSREFKHIVRLAGKDLDGSLKVAYALSGIKGIGVRLANAIISKAEIPAEERLGFLSEGDVRKLEEIINNVEKFGFPSWLLNYRRNPETGEDNHLITSDLDLQVKTNIERMKEIRSWRGYRHAYGLKVRGQKTRTTGRKGKAVGVKKKREAK
ncbi:MAG: 30S ribosomal protein S13 [Nitrososphaerota archaeon]|nr:30S ribosomal protein S13 [Candidatus Bathyarchaeota archaeon]MDW8048775.1 30S ribosomal protein S13 [Nitrososphaerota archaeon]